MTPIAIVVVGYNRVDSISRLLHSLENADYFNNTVDLIISIDKSDTDIVEKFSENFIWKYGKKKVIKHKDNLGLRKHILSQGELFTDYEALIVLEDDLIVSKSFYYYALSCFKKYKDDERVAGISLYAYRINYHNNLPFEPMKDEHDVYFMQCAMSWGQIWLKRQWQQFYEWYKLNLVFNYSDNIPEILYTWPKSSWLKYHTRYCIENDKYFVYPYYSLTSNYSDVGTHNNDDSNNTVYQVNLQCGLKKEFLLPSLDQSDMKYDGYFENLNLAKILNIKEDEICIDLYGSKKNKLNKRYWLTFNKLNYKIVESYDIALRPIELNIINKLLGEKLFLYDTDCVQNNKNKEWAYLTFYRFYLKDSFTFLRMIGINIYYLGPIKILIRKIRKKMAKFIQKKLWINEKSH